MKMLLSIVILATILTAGCSTTPAVKLQPVHNLFPALASDVYLLRVVDVKPIAVFREQPLYPQALRKSGVSGEAIVQFILDTNGLVTEVVVVSASDIRFGNAAIEAISKWRFKPARVGDQPVKCCMQQPFYFEIND